MLDVFIIDIAGNIIQAVCDYFDEALKHLSSVVQTKTLTQGSKQIKVCCGRSFLESSLENGIWWRAGTKLILENSLAVW